MTGWRRLCIASKRSTSSRPVSANDTEVDGRLLTERRERAYLVGLSGLPEFGDWPAEVSLEELARLVDTAGADTAGRTTMHVRRAHPATLLGAGQLDVVVAAAKADAADVIVLDGDLLPRQQRNLERAFGGKVLDRTAVILDIFAARAHTVEGRLQVERAQLEYLLPRLSELWVRFSRQRGGIGPFRGPGETQLETDRRLYRDRISALERRLEEVRLRRGGRRQRRRDAGLLVGALIGYTNAGKSTLLNVLTGATAHAEDKLFATLDPTTRRLEFVGGGVMLLTDTVGFIQRLPTRLVTAFRATLEEALEAQVLIHVVDLASPDFRRQVAVVEETLDTIGVGPRPVITVLNKIDVAPPPDLSAFPNAVAVSARTGAGLADLRAQLALAVRSAGVQVEVSIPYAQGELVDLFHQQGTVTVESHEPGGTRIRGTLPPELMPRFRRFRAGVA
ncbi:MAG: GTPase HflX [Actinobacteria bacterium]|nr:GTPase HflX [Actinomycetota bacterium]